MLLSDSDRGGEVEHRVHVLEPSLHRRALADVADHELHVGREVPGPTLRRAVDLRRQVVEGSSTP